MPDEHSVSAVVALFETDDGDGVLAALPGLSDDGRGAARALRRRLCAMPGPELRQGLTDRA